MDQDAWTRDLCGCSKFVVPCPVGATKPEKGRRKSRCLKDSGEGGKGGKG